MKHSQKAIASGITALLLLAGVVAAVADDWPQWRGPQRNGISAETGLLKEWPATGPQLVWKLEDIGSGYAAASIVGDRIYILGNQGLENEYVQALSAKGGQRLWSTRLGNVGNPKQQPSFPAARSTPTIEGGQLYALGSDGDLACVDVPSGAVRWQKNLRTDFGGMPGQWAYAESPLIVGDLLVCTPGGSQATIVALNKTNGEVAWKCALPEADEAAYASAIVVDAEGVRQCVQLLQKGLVGVDIKTGNLLWRYSKAISRYGANIPTPLVSNGAIYVAAAGTGGGLVKLTLKDGRVEPEQLYFEAKFPTAIGGAVKVGENLFGTTGQALLCLDFASGKLKWEERAIGSASLCYADGRLYLHGENGEVALVEPSADGYREKGRFTPPNPPKRSHEMEKAWAYPALSNGRLYIRDHGSLWCYDIRSGG